MMNLCNSRTEHIEETVTLSFDNCTVDDEGDFTVKAINEKGVASCSAEVLVHVLAPKVTKPLSDITVNVKDTARLDCTITGLPKPEVIWTADDVILNDSPKYKITSRDDDYSLDITDVTLDDTEKNYTCKATNVAGDVSTSARLLPQGLFDALFLVPTYSMLLTIPYLTQCTLAVLCMVIQGLAGCNPNSRHIEHACAISPSAVSNMLLQIAA